MSWAPNGKQLAFVSDSHFGDPHLAVVDVRTARVHPLKLFSWDAPPAWSPDSSKLAVADYRQGTIHVVRSDGHVVKTLRVHASTAPAWSPDGKMLAFGRGNPDQPGNPSVVLTISPAGGPTHVVATLPQGSQVIQLEWRKG